MKNALKQWLSTNSHCFNHPPYNIQTGVHATISFNLAGITQVLTWQVTDYDVMLMVCHQKSPDEESTFWDGLVDFDVSVKQSAAGEYYCNFCKEQHREYFPTQMALWQSHCFENLLNWSNQHITPNKILALFRTEGGST